jgi:predicted GIY-YIG superfamily endonuclease
MVYCCVSISAMPSFLYVYVLLSKRDSEFYISSTNDLERRITEHSNSNNISTEKRLPLDLIYFEGHLSKIDAARRERYFKTNKGKTTLRQMLRNSLKHA